VQIKLWNIRIIPFPINAIAQTNCSLRNSAMQDKEEQIPNLTVSWKLIAPPPAPERM